MAFLKKRVSIIFLIINLLSLSLLSAQSKTDFSVKDISSQGFEAYRSGDWNTAVFLLKKAVSLNYDSSADTLYMLVMAEMHCEDYKGAVADSNLFLEKHKGSPYAPYINYQKGRALYYLGEYNASILLLSDFCHENPENEMYASALFWIAESFYNTFRFGTARPLYERIVTDFPNEAKVPQAEYRIETIDQRSREEKLLYLLKMTGEEYLAAKENYEKQLKEYQTEGLVGVQRQLKFEQDKNASLSNENELMQRKITELQNLIDALKSTNVAPAPTTEKKEEKQANSEIILLKKKASEVESLLNNEEGR